MDILIKAAGIGIIAAIAAVLLKKDNPSFSFAVVIGTAVLIIASLSGVFAEIVNFAESAAQTAGISEVLVVPVFKTIGIAVVSKISADICRDAGQSSIAAAVETAGAVIAFYIAMPLIQTVLKMVNTLT